MHMVVNWRKFYVKMMPTCNNASQRIQGLLEAYFKQTVNGVQEKTLFVWRWNKKSVPQDHRLSSRGKPRDANR